MVHAKLVQGKFQSLLGFLIRCNVRSATAWGAVPGFQSLLGFLIRCNTQTTLLRSPIAKFQSLLGFLIRCNRAVVDQEVERSLVSIPIGFSNPLQRPRCG